MKDINYTRCHLYDSLFLVPHQLTHLENRSSTLFSDQSLLIGTEVRDTDELPRLLLISHTEFFISIEVIQKKAGLSRCPSKVSQVTLLQVLLKVLVHTSTTCAGPPILSSHAATRTSMLFQATFAPLPMLTSLQPSRSSPSVLLSQTKRSGFTAGPCHKVS